MDRRTLLKGAGALALLPLLPALASGGAVKPIVGKTVIEAAIQNDWHHYAVTLCDGVFEAMIDGETVQRPTGNDYDILEMLTKNIERSPSGPIVTAEVHVKAGPQSGEGVDGLFYSDYLGRVIV
jgi:hypothetical protein